MKTLLTVMTLIFVVWSASCSRQPDGPPRHPLIGRYVLAGYNDSGQLIFTGEISLTSVEQNHVKGRCVIKPNENAPQGLFEQNGDCDGLLEGKKLDMDLAPSMDDGGVLFEGEIDGGRIRGVCLFDSFVGSHPFGRFEAVKSALG